MSRSVFALASLIILAASPAHALQITYSLNMTGDQVVPGPGDPDGLATGTLRFDDSTGVISGVILYSNLGGSPHIHIHGPGGEEGQNADLFIYLGWTQPVHGRLHISEAEDPADVAQILANPSGFYVDAVTFNYPDGALRSQLLVPEPATLCLVGLSVAALARRRRRV